MSEAAVAERYARAIFELGEQSGQVTVFAEHLRKFNDTLSGNQELFSVLLNPVLPEETRDRVISAVASRLALNLTATNAIRLLGQRQRLRALPEITERVVALADEKNSVVRVTVTSARLLSDSYVQRLTRELEQSTGKRVMLERREDPSLIAGIVTQIGDNTIDGSLKGRLDDYQQRLLTAK
jgi:F-type H+-transporting ATPase subunit delta